MQKNAEICRKIEKYTEKAPKIKQEIKNTEIA